MSQILLRMLRENKESAIVEQALEKYNEVQKQYKDMHWMYEYHQLPIELHMYIKEPLELLIYLWRKMDDIAPLFELVERSPVLNKKYVFRSAVSRFNLNITIAYKHRTNTLYIAFHNGTKNVIQWSYYGRFSWRQEGVLLPPLLEGEFVVDKIIGVVNNLIEYAKICNDVY